MAGVDQTPAWAKGQGPPPAAPLRKAEMEDMIRKLLFMPPIQTHMLVKPDEWDQLDLTLLQSKKFLSDYDVEVAIGNRGLDMQGGRNFRVTRLMSSIIEQRSREGNERQAELERRWARMKALGGCFTMGKGTRGCLATGHRFHSDLPLHVRGLANDRVMRVFTGSDSNIVMALTRTEDVFVWGSCRGPLGLPGKQKPQPIFVKPEDEYQFAEPGEESDVEDEDDLLKPVKMDRMSKEHIVSVSVGRNHALALTYHGDVFGWGFHNQKQLGFLIPKVGAGMTDQAEERALESENNASTNQSDTPTLVRPDHEVRPFLRSFPFFHSSAVVFSAFLVTPHTSHLTPHTTGPSVTRCPGTVRLHLCRHELKHDSGPGGAPHGLGGAGPEVRDGVRQSGERLH